MLDGPLSELLQVKWKSSVRGKFYSWLAMFLLLLLIAALAYVTRLDFRAASKWAELILSNQSDESLRRESGRPSANRTSLPANATSRSAAARVQLLVYQTATGYKLANQYSESALVCCVLYYLFTLTQRSLIESRTSRNQQQQQQLAPGHQVNAGPMRILVQAPELIIFTCTCLLILFCVPLRLLAPVLGHSREQELEDFLAALIMFLLPMKLLFFCRGSKSLGSFIVMIYKILVNDVLCFVLFLVIFIAGFGQSFILIFKTYKPKGGLQTSVAQNESSNVFESLISDNQSYFLTFYDAFLSLHMVALNEFSWVVDEFGATDYPNLARIIFCVYMVLVSILLVNMLIAMLGKTYQDIASQPNESLRQWARALLTVERMCSRVSRLGMLDKYTHRQGRKLRHCYSSTWALNEQDLQKINTIQQLNREHQSNASRLEAREVNS